MSFLLFPPNKQSRRVPGGEASIFILQLKSNNLKMSFCINGCNPSSKNPKIISEKMEKERKRWTKIFVLQDEPPNHCYKASGSVCKSGATRTRSCLIKKIERNVNWDRIMGMGLQYTFDQPLGMGVFIKRMELKWWWVSSPLKTTLINSPGQCFQIQLISTLISLYSVL